MKNNIILVGMMGAGKTFIGQKLKEAYPKYNLIDLDEYIEKHENKKISDIFAEFGEEHFRNLETSAIEILCMQENQIISLGGGAFEKEINREILNNNGYTVYLKASGETLFNRIKNETHRPLLKQGFGIEKVNEILKKRERNYAKALITVDTTDKTFYNIIDEIMKRIEENAKQN